ncbi:DOG1 (YHR044C) [Zygosaccharomyces parabailii]|nr:DOG1 (YHR044C) [Zygosaccharomyces parabailii]CDH16265.1 related to 2-deoxyglucose-6-phosphate phosphatase 2 [Zygosaccharomyces bailii ISA1307]
MPLIEAHVCLFDLDGTLVDTGYASECAWSNLCNRYHRDPSTFMNSPRPCLTTEAIKKFFPEVANDSMAVEKLEYSIVKDYLNSVRLIPGAKRLLEDLNVNSSTHNKFVRQKWAVVTSGSPYLAHAWFRTILKDVGMPEVFVTARDVSKDKPDPEGYSKACFELCESWDFSMKIIKKVVFEDTPIRIRAGKAMGATVVAVKTTCEKAKLFEAGADYVVTDLESVSVKKNTFTSPIILQIKDPLTKE